MQILQNPEISYEPLTSREMEVLVNVAKGLSNKEIASKLGIKYGTVRHYISNIYVKIHVRDKTQAILYGICVEWIYLNNTNS